MPKGTYRVWVAMLGALASVVLPAAAQETVYFNINNDPTLPWQPVPNGVEIGDDVTLAGTGRFITRFGVPVFNNIDQTFNGTVTGRFYDLDQDGLPGTELFEQTIPIIPGGFVGDRTLDFTPNVLVPDSFIWTIQFATNLPSTEQDGFGPLLNDTPQVGSSEDVAFSNNRQPGDDEWLAFFYGSDPPLPTDPKANYQALIGAVPEPGALGLLGIAALAMTGRRRR